MVVNTLYFIISELILTDQGTYTEALPDIVLRLLQNVTTKADTLSQCVEDPQSRAVVCRVSMMIGTYPVSLQESMLKTVSDNREQ